MDERHRYRTLVESELYMDQRDFLATRYSHEILSSALTGVLWGIASSPEGYERVTVNIREARSRSFSAAQPEFKISFEILDSERVLLLWIEEITGLEGLEKLVKDQ